MRLTTAIDTRAPAFAANDQAMRVLVEDLRVQAARIAAGGGEASRARVAGRDWSHAATLFWDGSGE